MVVLEICVVFVVVCVGIVVVPEILVIPVVFIVLEMLGGRGGAGGHACRLWVNVETRDRSGACEHVVCARVIVEIDTRDVIAELLTAWPRVVGRPHRGRWRGGFCGGGLSVRRGWRGGFAARAHDYWNGEAVV